MAALTDSQQKLARGAINKHLLITNTLAGAAINDVDTGIVVNANEIIVIKKVSVRNTHAVAGTAFFVGLSDNTFSNSTAMARLCSFASEAPDTAGYGDVIAATTAGNSLKYCAGAATGTAPDWKPQGAYTGTYVLEILYCIIPNL